MWNFELGRREERHLVVPAIEATIAKIAIVAIIAILATVAIIAALDYAKII